VRKVIYFIQQSWLLIIAAFIFGLLLAVTSAVLTPRIQANEAKMLNDKMKALITDANDFEPVIEDVVIAGTRTDIYEALDISGQSLGFALVATGPGFSDKIKLVIAVNESCSKYFGFEVLSSNETPGFGSKIIENYFNNQFVGAPSDKLELVKSGDDKKIDGQIVAITGATVSSEAVVKIFNRHIDKLKEILTDKGLIEK
jgi:RnfABCDGE-type electron transport complex G subunit